MNVWVVPMSDLPLCKTCGGTGELFEDSMSVVGIPGGHIAVGPCPAGCMPVRVPYGEIEPGLRAHRVLHLDPAKVVLWCETHGGSSVEPTGPCWVDEHLRQGGCRIVVATFTIVGKPA